MLEHFMAWTKKKIE